MNLNTLKKNTTSKVLILALPFLMLFGIMAPLAEARDHHRGRHDGRRGVNRQVQRHHYQGRGRGYQRQRGYYRHRGYANRHHHGYWRHRHGHRYWYENGSYYNYPGGLSISIGL